MRSMAGLLGLIVAGAIALLVYKFYFTQSAPAALTNPIQTIDIIGVKNDLIAIAQAERTYEAQYTKYGSLDDLVTSGAMSLRKSGRDGYTYNVETSAGGFRVVANCPQATSPGCTNYAVDQAMEVQAIP
jgi:hypothetical protein